MDLSHFSEKARNHNWRRTGLVSGIITMGVLLGSYIHQSITVGDETVRYKLEPECVFYDETKQVTRGTEEGLGSLAVRTIPGVDWSVCSDDAITWIEENNPGLKNEPGEKVVVPIQVGLR